MRGSSSPSGDVLRLATYCPEREKAICETRPVKRGRAADSHLCDDLARVLTLAALCNHLEACKVAALAPEEDLGRIWCETERLAGSAVQREVASIRIVCGRVAEGALLQEGPRAAPAGHALAVGSHDDAAGQHRERAALGGP